MSALKLFRHACSNGSTGTCITAWDFPTARLAVEAGLDLILIGDSTGINSLGLDSTVGITLDEIIYHCKSVARAARGKLFILGDMPLGTYEVSPRQAAENALRMVKQGNVDGVKLEGGKEMAPQVEAITKAGVPVFGHIGLTPQRALATAEADYDESDDRLSFGSTGASAELVLQDAVALQNAGAAAVLLEAVAMETAEYITRSLKVPTIGIGCGPGTSAQMVVQTDVLGYLGAKLGRWHKQYLNVGEQSVNALKAYKQDCQEKRFPAKEHGYDMVREDMAPE